MLQVGVLKDRRILVTGGSSGLGLAMADRFAELGAHVLLCGRRQEVLEEARAGIAARHATPVQAMACDVRDAGAKWSL